VYGADVINELIEELHTSVEMSAGFEGEMKSLVAYARSAAAPAQRQQHSTASAGQGMVAWKQQQGCELVAACLPSNLALCASALNTGASPSPPHCAGRWRWCWSACGRALAGAP
jgi:hypothetical protein